MSVKYGIAEMKNPLRPEDPAKFYAKAQARAEVDHIRIVREIAYSSSLTLGDVLNVIYGLIDKTNEHLADGDIVSLGDFGKFQYQVSSTGTETEKTFNSACINKVKLQFRPGGMFKKELSNLKFEKVISVKARKLAAKNQGQEVNP